MHEFFGFDSYNNLSLAELETMLKDAPEHKQVLQNKIKQKCIVKSKLAIEDKINHFFNFGNFSEKAFSAYVEACTTKHKNGGDISIDDAIMLAQSAPMAMYIVTLSRSGEVFFAGKTTNLLAYLGKYSRQYEADSASFEAVNEEYATDVLLATMFYFDLPLDTVRITRANRKYTTLKQACFVYSRVESIRRKTILNVIRTHKFRTIELPYGDIVLDKIALERALRC